MFTSFIKELLMKKIDHVYDCVGVGFGPSNLALAIALDEVKELKNRHLNCLFFDKKQSFSWHEDMLLDGTSMQISFLKDLVTLRNPQSKYTFINYLHQRHGLNDFINLKTFFPSRIEFNDYLCWVAKDFECCTKYDSKIFLLEPIMNGNQVVALAVHVENSSGTKSVYQTRNLILGAGGKANIPELFRQLGINQNVFHSSNYLQKIQHIEAGKQFSGRIAVVGAGQSAAEIFVDLSSRFPNANIDMISRSPTLKPADDSPFVNEIFNPQFIDFVYQKNDFLRKNILDYFRDTNYSVVDGCLIQKIYEMMYVQKLVRKDNIRLLFSKEIISAHLSDSMIKILLQDRFSQQQMLLNYDFVVLATGYQRNARHGLLKAFEGYFDNFKVDRCYRIKTQKEFLPKIYLQGYCETTHGLSDTLLSVLALRSAEIVDDLLDPSPNKKAIVFNPPISNQCQPSVNTYGLQAGLHVDNHQQILN